MTARVLSGVTDSTVSLYEETKRELEALEYNDYLGLESLLLVRKLVSDLVLTTESHERLQGRVEVLERELGELHERHFHSTRSVSRLTRENNQLHLSLIETKEKADERARELSVQIQSAQDRIQEATFLTQQWKAKFDTLNKKNIDHSSPLADQQSQERSEKLLNETMEAKAKALEAANQVDHLKLQIELRDKEIMRLGESLEKLSSQQQQQQSVPDSQDIKDEDSANKKELYNQIDFLNRQLLEQNEMVEQGKKERKRAEKLAAELQQREKELGIALVKLAAAQDGQQRKEQEEQQQDHRQVNDRGITFSKLAMEQTLEEAKSGELAALLEAYSEDKKRFSSVVSALESDLQAEQDIRASSEQKVQEITSQCAAMEGKIEQLQREREAALKDLQDTQKALAKLHSEQVSFEESRSTLTKEIETLETVIEEQKTDLASLSDKLSETKRELFNTRKELQATQQERDALQQSAMDQEGSSRQSSLAIETLRQERDGLQRQVDHLFDDLKTAKLSLQDAKAEAQEATAKLERSQGQCRILEEEVRTLTAQVVAKSEQYHKEAGARAELERLADLPGTIHELEEQLSRWRQRSADLDTESKRMARELEHAMAEKEDYLEERQRMDAAMLMLREKQESANVQVRRVTLENEDLRVKINALTDERDHYARQVKESNAQLSEKTTQLAAVQMALDQARGETEDLTAQVEALRRREVFLKEQGDSLRDAISRLESNEVRVKEELTTARTSATGLQEQVKKLDQELNVLRKEKKTIEAQSQDSEQRARDLANVLETERSEKEKLAQHLEQFKSVFSKLDETRGSLQARVKELYSALQKEKSRSEELEKQSQVLEESARAVSEKNAHLERSVRELHDQRNKLRKQLETQAKSSSELESAVNTQEMSYRELEQRLGAARSQLHAQAQALDLKDEQVAKLNEDLNAAKRSLVQLEQVCRERGTELAAASEDLANMTRENQSVNASFQSIRIERDQLRSQLSEALARASRMEGLLESNKLEKADLLNVYRRACDETSRLKRLVQELSSSRAKVVGEQQAQQVDTSRLRQRLAESEELCRRQQVDLQAFERQVAELSRQLHGLQTRLELNEEEKSFAERTASTARETTHEFAQREQSLRWEISQNQAEIERLAAKVARLEGENEALHAKLLYEKRRFQDLELVVEKARRAQARAEQQERSKDEAFHSLRTALVDREIQQEKSYSEDDRHRSPRGETPRTPDNQGVRKASSESPQLREVHSAVESVFSEEALPRSQSLSFQADRYHQHEASEAKSLKTPNRQAKASSSSSSSSSSTSSKSASSAKSSSSADLEHISSELEALISDQSEVIRRMNQDRRTFGSIAARAREDLEASSSVLHHGRSPSPITLPETPSTTNLDQSS